MTKTFWNNKKFSGSCWIRNSILAKTKKKNIKKRTFKVHTQFVIEKKKKVMNVHGKKKIGDKNTNKILFIHTKITTRNEGGGENQQEGRWWLGLWM